MTALATLATLAALAALAFTVVEPPKLLDVGHILTLPQAKKGS
jgi:hypothetical protein